MFVASVDHRFRGSSVRPVGLTRESSLDVKSLRRAVVMLHALWSAPSTACLACLAALQDAPAGAWLYVIDIDAVRASWLEEQFGARSHGHGETFWIRDGLIVDRDQSYAMRHDSVARATRRLFADESSRC